MIGDLYLWIMIGLGSLMSFAIGSNETDALATTYSSGALSLSKCVSKSKINLSSYLRSDLIIFNIVDPWRYI